MRPLNHKVLQSSSTPYGRRILISILVFLTFNAGTPCFAQGYTDEVISLAEGLSQSSVFSLSQDQQGFLWAGTQDGLNKYDGLNFKTYYNIPFDSTSLSSAHVISMLHDSHGRFWVGTANQGLNLFIPGQEKFTRFFHQSKNINTLLNNTIHVIHEGPTGTIWIGTGNGLQRVIVADNDKPIPTVEFETVFRDTSSTGLFAITTIFEDKNGDVWVGTLRGLLKLSFGSPNKFLPEGGNIYTTTEGLISNEITAFQADSYGNYWIGTSKGLCVLDTRTNHIKKITFPKTDFMSWMTEVNNFCISSNGMLWIASGAGLFTLNSIELQNASHSLPTPHLFQYKSKLSNSDVLCVREDNISKGIMWIGTGAFGLIKLISTKDKNFYTNHLTEILPTAFVFSIIKDTDGIVWAGTTDGLIRFNKLTNKYALFRAGPAKKNQLPTNYITKLRLDKNDQMWVGTQKGLLKVKNRNSLQPEFIVAQINPEFPQVSIRDITFDKNGDLIITLPYSLYKYSLQDEKATLLSSISGSAKQKSSGYIFMSATIDSKENIWLGTSIGLYILPKQSLNPPFELSKFMSFYHEENDTTSLRSHTINNILEDSKGNIWLSTPNGSTKAVLKNNSVQFTNYSTKDGLKNNAVYGALENLKDGSLWLSTNGGLSKFDPVNIKFSNFDIHDGLQSNEFNGGSYFRAKDNELMFGGVNGYTSFYPDEIKEDSVAPKVFITAFSLTGENQNEIPIGADKKIELKYNQNSFNINFVALQYTSPSQNKYAYKLDGFQKEWTNNENNNQVNFSQLAPGEYIFQVIGCNSDGVISAKADTISILIHPPFWKTIWFYFLIALFISVVAWLLHAYLLRVKLRQVEEIEVIRKETAADFHDELGHKLTTIAWFSEILRNKINPEQKELRLHLDRIIDTAGGLYHTMKDLVWAMDPGQDSMKDLYKQIREFGESLFDQTGVEFKASEMNGEFDNISIPLSQKRHVLLIFKEAMHNSFRHSGSKLVRLDCFRENNHVTLKLEDNGSGFDLDWNKIGNGLKNVKKRTEEIGGKIKINSNNDGTTLELEVPLKS